MKLDNEINRLKKALNISIDAKLAEKQIKFRK
jgi:hypothetical protein